MIDPGAEAHVRRKLVDTPMPNSDDQTQQVCRCRCMVMARHVVYAAAALACHLLCQYKSTHSPSIDDHAHRRRETPLATAWRWRHGGGRPPRLATGDDACTYPTRCLPALLRDSIEPGERPIAYGGALPPFPPTPAMRGRRNSSDAPDTHAGAFTDGRWASPRPLAGKPARSRSVITPSRLNATVSKLACVLQPWAFRYIPDVCHD